MSPTPAKKRSRAAVRSTLLGVLVNAVLAAVKGVAGVLGNSYALVADAMESLLDIFHGLIVLGGVHLAAVEPDKNHPYGHGKAEPLAAMVAAIGILGGAVAIAIESVRQIQLENPPAPATFTLVVILLVILVKEGMFQYVHRIGRKVQSTAVKTDAWHHRSDALTSVAALIGIAIAVIGGPGWEKADDWAALAACAIIGYNSYRLLRPALEEVMDTAPPGELAEQVREVAARVPRVLGLDQCIVRKMGFEYFVDLHVYVDGTLTVSEGHDVAHRVKDAVIASNHSIRDVLIHIEPFEEFHPND
jgi:cation diffusion facilitator family transporter